MTRRPMVGDERHRTIAEAQVVALFVIRGWPYEARDGDPAACRRAAQAVLDRYVAKGLPFRRSATGARLFDIVEASNFLVWAGLEAEDETWMAHCVETDRRLTGGSPEAPVRTSDPRRYAVTLWRDFSLERWRPGERVRLRLPLPLEDASLDGVEIDILPSKGAEASFAVRPARLDAIVTVPPDRSVSLGYRASFTTRPTGPTGAGAALSPADAELYRRPREGLIKVSPRIAALAADLAGHETEGWAVLRRFWDYMINELAFGTIHYDRMDPARPLDHLLDAGWYNCQAGSALLAALCRARDIPARLVSGYMLHPAAPGFHTWMEAWIEGAGWAPFDLSSWNLSAGGVDPDWRDLHFGWIDHRMTVERPPRQFGGLGAVRLPPVWTLLASLDGPGSRCTFQDTDTGALVYSEHVTVEPLD